MSEKKTRRVACAICGEPVDVPINIGQDVARQI